MMYLSAEELVINIAEQSERAAAIIEHSELDSGKFDAGAVITSFLGNIFDSALIVTALEKCSGSGDCHRNAMSLVLSSPDIDRNVKQFVSQIDRMRKKYSLDDGNSGSDIGECLDFLNAYDCFMFDFLKNSSTVRDLTDRGRISMGFSSMRNLLEKLMKKNSARTSANASGESSAVMEELLRRNNELLEKMLGELTRIEHRLDAIEKRYNE